MKTIGVLGGLGPQATVEFQRQVHVVSQKLIPPSVNHGYPPMVVVYHRHSLVSLAQDGSPVLPLQPEPRLLRAAAALGSLSDFLVIVSNGAHRFASELSVAAGRPVLNLIELVLDEVARRGWNTVGALTYFDPELYRRPLEVRGMGCEVVGPDLQQRLDQSILAVMEGRLDAGSMAVAAEALAELRNRSVDGTILGCTEIPFLLGETAQSADLLDPLPLLAEAAVRAALAET